MIADEAKAVIDRLKRVKAGEKVTSVYLSVPDDGTWGAAEEAISNWNADNRYLADLYIKENDPEDDLPYDDEWLAKYFTPMDGQPVGTIERGALWSYLLARDANVRYWRVKGDDLNSDDRIVDRLNPTTRREVMELIEKVENHHGKKL